MQQRFEASPERVFDAITDHVAPGRWLNANIRIEVQGTPPPNGLGEVRVVAEGFGTRVDYRIRFTWPWYLGGSVVGGLVAQTLAREISAGLGRMAAGLQSSTVSPALA